MTGEMSQFEAEHAPEWALHRSIARAIKGQVRAFDVYQGPFIETGRGRLWLVCDNFGYQDCYLELERPGGYPGSVFSAVQLSSNASCVPTRARACIWGARMKLHDRRAILRKAIGALSANTRVMGWKCARCGHAWAARNHDYRLIKGARPIGCPRCKRRNWWIEDGILQKSRRTS